jgi:hypothetical protein
MIDLRKQNIDGKIVITRPKPRRPSVPQTEIDHLRCIERRRKNAPLFDRMTEILTYVTNGRMTKEVLLDLATKIADRKGIKIDRGAKRMKECLICWFCEHTNDVMALQASPSSEQTNDPPFASTTIEECDIDQWAPEFAWES